MNLKKETNLIDHQIDMFFQILRCVSLIIHFEKTNHSIEDHSDFTELEVITYELLYIRM